MKVVPLFNPIAHRNDCFRRTMNGEVGNVFVSAKVKSSTDFPSVLEAVRTFNTFDADDCQHDFGEVWIGNEQYFFRVDWFDGGDASFEGSYAVLVILHGSEGWT